MLFLTIKYKATNITLVEGDILLLMSDGLSEQVNNAGDQLGDESVMAVFEKSADKSAEGICADLIDLGKRWAEDNDQDDDITLIVIKNLKQDAS